MRNPNRINEILNTFKQIWEQYPDMRFGQLVVNLLGIDPFHMEDDVILKIFKESLNGDF